MGTVGEWMLPLLGHANMWQLCVIAQQYATTPSLQGCCVISAILVGWSMQSLIVLGDLGLAWIQCCPPLVNTAQKERLHIFSYSFNWWLFGSTTVMKMLVLSFPISICFHINSCTAGLLFGQQQKHYSNCISILYPLIRFVYKQHTFRILNLYKIWMHQILVKRMVRLLINFLLWNFYWLQQSTLSGGSVVLGSP